MTKEEIYRKLKEIVKPHHGYTAQMNAIAEWVNSEFEALKQGQSLPIDSVVVSETELCDNPHCEDGIVDRDMYGHPIYCQVCDKHN